MTEKPQKKIRFGFQPLPENIDAKSIHTRIATWFGAGRFTPAPGTMGTLAAVPFGYAIAAAGGMAALGVAALILLFVGTRAATRFGTQSGKKDDQRIVVDEVAGMWIAAIPAGTDVALWVLAFVLFRLFDIYKPWPASFFDKRESAGRKASGFDVMMDDVVAGIYAFFGVATMSLHFAIAG